MFEDLDGYKKKNPQKIKHLQIYEILLRFKKKTFTPQGKAKVCSFYLNSIKIKKAVKKHEPLIKNNFKAHT